MCYICGEKKCIQNSDGEITVDEMGKSCATYGEKRNTYRILMGKLLGMRWTSHVLHMGKKCIENSDGETCNTETIC
jgi:hypothetical protein